MARQSTLTLIAAFLVVVNAWSAGAPSVVRRRATRVCMGAMTDALYAGYGLQPVEEEKRRTPVELLALNVKQLQQEQIDGIHGLADTLFNIVDRNGDGEVSKEELAAHMLLARYSEEAVDALFDLIDTDKNGMMSRDELRDAFVRHPSLRSAPGLGTLSKSKRAAVHEEADSTFDAIDKDGNGKLSLQELQDHLAGTEGPSYSAEAVEKIFRSLLTRKSEEVTRSEFRGAYVRYRALRLAFGLNWVLIVKA